MQFLESKAAGDDSKGSKKSTKSSGTKKTQQAHQRRRSTPPPSAPHAVHNPFTPPMNPEDQPFFPSPSPPACTSPPPFASYGHTTYSPPSDGGFYTTAPHPVAVTTWMATAAIPATAAPTLPPMNHFSDAAAYASGAGSNKGNESMFAGYGDYSLGVPTTASPYDSNPHVSSQEHQHPPHPHHQASRFPSSHVQHDSALLPPVSTFPSYGGSDLVSSSSSSSLAAPVNGQLAAPDMYRSRYLPTQHARV